MGHKFMDWRLGAVLLGLLMVLVTMLVKPIGVSTQFAVLDGIISGWFSPESLQTNAYFVKYASKISSAPFNYGFMFVIGMILGGFISARTGGLKSGGCLRMVPPVWARTVGGSCGKRALASFVGGVLVLFGARLAGGCTSGHIISGVSQMAVSGLVFAAATFATAIPLAFFLYNRKKGNE